MKPQRWVVPIAAWSTSRIRRLPTQLANPPHQKRAPYVAGKEISVLVDGFTRRLFEEAPATRKGLWCLVVVVRASDRGPCRITQILKEDIVKQAPMEKASGVSFD